MTYLKCDGGEPYRYRRLPEMPIRRVPRYTCSPTLCSSFIFMTPPLKCDLLNGRLCLVAGDWYLVRSLRQVVELDVCAYVNIEWDAGCNLHHLCFAYALSYKHLNNIYTRFCGAGGCTGKLCRFCIHLMV